LDVAGAAVQRAFLVALTILSIAGLSACSDDDPAATSSPSQAPTVAPVTPDPAATPGATPAPAPSLNPDELYAFFTTSGATVALQLEVADTPEERTTGLMFRESLPPDVGMLFDFQGETQAGFWMKNTLIPLSIAFIDSNGVVVHIEDMQPQTENLHTSPTPYRYAIEANQGWYTQHGIQIGDFVQIRPG
jgi:uncharacterized protein